MFTPGSYGSISGLLRTVQNIGLVGNYGLAISAAAASVPRQVAFEVLIGTSSLSGGESTSILRGLHNAFYASIAILVIAAVLAYFRRKEVRKEQANPKI
jgi:hypothetical protein